MAISDVQQLLPRIESGRTAGYTELVELIKERTGLHKSDVAAMLAELEDVLMYFMTMGRGVKLAGIGTFAPSIRMDGSYHIGFRPASELNRRINTPGAFTGKILNQENIGKSLQELEEQLAEEQAGD